MTIRHEYAVLVRQEMSRLNAAMLAMGKAEEAINWHMTPPEVYYTGPLTAAVKRASLDLTRALARMRRRK